MRALRWRHNNSVNDGMEMCCVAWVRSARPALKLIHLPFWRIGRLGIEMLAYIYML
jgi:hypothetical protein